MSGAHGRRSLVETEGEVRLLREMGVQYAQGFLYSPTRPPEERMALFGVPVLAGESRNRAEPRPRFPCCDAAC